MAAPMSRWISVILSITLLLIGFFLLLSRYWPSAHWQLLEHELEQKYGISIELENIDFPASFRAQKARYRETLPIERAAVLERLALDLSHYPAAFIDKHLNGIVIVRSLELNGLPYGGTYDIASRRIFLDSGWLGDDGSKHEAMGLHHEFSSLLMRLNPDVFKTSDWAALNPKDFEYRFSASTAANLATNRLDLVGRPELWEKGFLCEYGQLTLEDDINTFAQYLIAGKQRLPDLVEQHPRLSPKMQLLRRWYCALDLFQCAES